MLRISIGLALLSLVLSVCFTGTDVNDMVFVTHPVVTVSAGETSVGDFVEVSVSTSMYFHRLSRVPKVAADVQLGVRLMPDWLVADDGVSPGADNCVDSELFGTDAYFESTEDFSLPAGDMLSMTVPLSLDRGQTIELEHTFSIEAEREGAVILSGRPFAHRSEGVPAWGGVVCVAECATVTWQ